MRHHPSKASRFLSYWLTETVRLLEVSVLILHSFGVGYCFGGDESAGPALDTDPQLFADMHVIQRRGWVLDMQDADNLITNGFWILSNSASGHVVRVDTQSSMLYVQFDSRDGWTRMELQTKRRFKTVKNVDDYGNEFSESWVEEGLAVTPGDHGKIISDDGLSEIVVRFPVSVVGLRPPQKGDVVIRGPDWDPRRRVDGCRGRGSEEPCTGIVVQELSNDFYVRVKWSKSGLTESHRFDCRRYYDIVVADPVD